MDSTPPHPYLAALGKRLREVRKSKGFSTEHLAEQTQMAPQNVRQIEAGRRNVTVLTLLRCAEALGVQVPALLPEPLPLTAADPERQQGPSRMALLIDAGWAVQPCAADRPTPGPEWLPAFDAALVAGPVADYRSAEVSAWVRPPPQRHLASQGLFLLRVAGESMAPLVADGAWCLCRAPVQPPLVGKVVVVQHGEPGSGVAAWQLKRVLAVEAMDDGLGIRLRLGSRNPLFQPVVVEARSETELEAVGELVEVIGG